MKKILFLVGLISLQACNMAIKDGVQRTIQPVEGEYTVSGTTDGLPWGYDLEIFVNGDPITDVTQGDGPFQSNPLQDGDTYDVTIGDLPGGYVCKVNNPTGMVDSANINNIEVNCSCSRENRSLVNLDTTGSTEVWNAQELVDLSSSEKPGDIIQMCDLDYADIKDPQPIGSFSTPYKGTYDGQGLAILDYVNNNVTAPNAGIFGMTHGAHIHDLNLVGLYLNNSCSMGQCTSMADQPNMGGLIGYAQNTMVDNIYGNDITITAAYESDILSNFNVGGLVGLYNDWNASTSHIQNIHVENVTVDGGNAVTVGGIIGDAITNINPLELIKGTNVTVISDGGSANTKCGSVVGRLWRSTSEYNSGGLRFAEVTESSVRCEDIAGGLVGYLDNSISQSLYQGSVSSSKHAGGIVGQMRSQATIHHALAHANVEGTVIGYMHNGAGEGSTAVPFVDNSYYTGVTCSQCADNPTIGGDSESDLNALFYKELGNATLAAWDFNTDWCEVDTGRLPSLRNVPRSLCN